MLNFIPRLQLSEWVGYVGIFKGVLIGASRTVSTFLIVYFDECAIVKEAQDAYLLNQESNLKRVNLQLNGCPSKSTTHV